MACAKSPARVSGVSVCARRRISALAAEQARDHALDIAVDRTGAATECNCGDRRGRIRADAGQRPQLAFLVRKLAAVALDERARASVQIAGASVIAEPGPDLQHFLERRRGERADARPALEEFGVIGQNRADPRLLQHDLGEPDPIRIRALAGARAPRQLAAMPVVPGEQGLGVKTIPVFGISLTAIFSDARHKRCAGRRLGRFPPPLWGRAREGGGFLPRPVKNTPLPASLRGAGLPHKGGGNRSMLGRSRNLGAHGLLALSALIAA